MSARGPAMQPRPKSIKAHSMRTMAPVKREHAVSPRRERAARLKGPSEKLVKV
jgi:hypothetical protein